MDIINGTRRLQDLHIILLQSSAPVKKSVKGQKNLHLNQLSARIKAKKRDTDFFIAADTVCS